MSASAAANLRSKALITRRVVDDRLRDDPLARERDPSMCTTGPF